MPSYLIHRLKDHVRQQFRWAPHTIGLTMIRPKDYEPANSVSADSHYAAWVHLRGSSEALQPGDVLESESGELKIYKYVGFEQAQWQTVEVKAAPEAGTPAEAPPAAV